MKTILQFALSWVTRIPWSSLRKLWSVTESLVRSLEFNRLTGGSMSKAEKLEYVLERVKAQVPDTHQEIASQLIRAIVELVLIGLRIKGIK